MDNLTGLLETRREIKSKKPEFERQDANIFRQFRGKWRRPKGLHSKMRRGFKGHKDVPSIGYSSPKKVKGLTKNGMRTVILFNIKDLDKVVDGYVGIISSSIGLKKKVEILKVAKEKSIKISGVKDFDKFINSVKEKLDARKRKSESKKDAQKKKVEKIKEETKKDESKK